MTVSLQRTLKDAGATAAAQLTAPVFNLDGSGVSASIAGSTWTDGTLGTTYYGAGDNATGPTYTSNVGFRRAFSAAQNLTDRQFIQWRMIPAWNSDGQKTWANGGGFVIVFYDGAGNWAGYKLTAGDQVWTYASEGTGVFFEAARGGFVAGPNLGDYRAQFFHLDRTRTPDYSSGTINWATVAGYELHVRPTASGTRAVVIVAQIYTVDNPLCVGTGAVTTMRTDLRNQLATLQGIGQPQSNCFDGVSSFPMFGGAPSSVFFSAIGAQIGNGGTDTVTGTLAAGTLAFLNPPEDTHQTASPRYYGLHGYFLPGTTSRLIDIWQGASDSVTVNDQNWASSRAWGVKVRGSASGTAAFNRCVFTRPSQFECAHATLTDCLWDEPTAPVQVTLDTDIVRGVIRNGTHGLKITGAAGNYSVIATSLGGASTYDIQVGSGGAGTYNLPNISATGTLKIRNDSATNAVVVSIPSGIAYSTSTAGGTISVTTPAVYQSVTVNGLVSGSRLQIYDTTSSTELYNAVVAGTSHTWSDSVAAAGNRAIRVRIAHVSGTTAYNFLEANIGTAGTGSSNSALTYLANQTLDTTYNSNAIDGSTVTDITISDGIDRVVIAKAGGSVTWPTIYAYQCYWNFTAAGIVDDGAIITASDTANYRVVGFKIRNTSTVPLVITGGYGVDSGTGLTATIIDSAGSTGNIYAAPEHVVAYATGSGLSASQASELTAAATDSAAAKTAAKLAAALSA